MRKSRPALLVAAILTATPALADPNIEKLAQTCNNCHGANGQSAGPNMPSIGGIPEVYLKKVMLEWKHGKRYAATMDRLIKGYSDAEIEALAAYYAKKAWVPAVQKVDTKLAKRGEEMAQNCVGCHGDTGAPPDDATPNLNGQWSHYLEMALLKCRDDLALMPHQTMRDIAKSMSEGEIKALAQYYASQN